MAATTTSSHNQHRQPEEQVRIVNPKLRWISEVPNNHLLKSGIVRQLGFKKPSLKDRVILLYSTFALLAKKSPISRNLKPTWVISFTDAFVLDYPAEEFKIISGEQLFVFFASDTAEKREWVRLIQQCVNSALESDRKRPLRKLSDGKQLLCQANYTHRL